MHVDDGVGHTGGEFHFVGDQHHGHATFGQGLNHTQHFAGELRVERGGHFVEQHHLRLHRQRAGDRHTLLLAARELLGVRLCLVGQAHLLQGAGGDLAGLGRGHVLHGLGGECDVLLHGEVGEQVVALEHDAHVLAQLAQVDGRVVHGMAADLDGAAVDDLQPVDAAQRGALARAAFADDGHHLALRDGEGHPLEHLVAAEALVDVLEFDNRGHVFLFHVAFAEGVAARLPNCRRCSSLRLQSDRGKQMAKYRIAISR